MLDDLEASASPVGMQLQSALPTASPALRVTMAEGLRVLVFRHLAGGAEGTDEVLGAHGLPSLPAPGICLGSDPWQVWIGPSESLLLTSDDVLADRVVAALRPGCQGLACVLDQSAGWLAFDLLGAGVDALLPRLLDASAIPGHPGRGVRARFVDISAMVMRIESDRVLLVVERPHARYAADWIGHAWRSAQG